MATAAVDRMGYSHVVFHSCFCDQQPDFRTEGLYGILETLGQTHSLTDGGSEEKPSLHGRRRQSSGPGREAQQEMGDVIVRASFQPRVGRTDLPRAASPPQGLLQRGGSCSARADALPRARRSDSSLFLPVSLTCFLPVFLFDL
ncbi:hypothetical protein SKAU_G00117710 [Synaphobranchus kaupii]|uniref:Uncharacterized protein n=1 Tax=Synaphobranchus kaupii TaxID=118154 RepID=A0A9Q1FNJ0_SYNKA|nr:hypothetical protein SKAU_G00117710 [Synaphobranchus kaupii]